MKKDNLPKPQNLRRIDRVRSKENTNLVDEVIDSIQTSNITEDNKFVKRAALLIIQLLGIKEIKNKKKRRTILEKKNWVKYECTSQRC